MSLGAEGPTSLFSDRLMDANGEMTNEKDCLVDSETDEEDRFSPTIVYDQYERIKKPRDCRLAFTPRVQSEALKQNVTEIVE